MFNIDDIYTEADLFRCPDTPATLLNTAMVNHFGAEWYSWEPETIYDEIEEYIQVKGVSKINKDKLHAISTILAFDGYYNQYHIFENVSKALNHELVLFEEETPLESEEVTWSIMEAHLLDDTPKKFSPEVKGYICQAYRHDGLIKTPEFIKKFFDGWNFRPAECDTREQQKKQLRIKAYCTLQLANIKNGIFKLYGKDIGDILTEHSGIGI